MTVDDDDDNNNVNKYKITGGKIMDSIMKRSLTKECKSKVEGCITSRMGKKIRHLGNVSFIITGQNRSNSMCIRK